MKYTKADLLKVIAILLEQIKEEQRLRAECIAAMMDLKIHLSETEVQKRIKEILESPHAF